MGHMSIAGRPLRIPSDLAHRLQPAAAPVPDPGTLRHAAVLALLIPGGRSDDDETRIVLIERARTLRAHAGQLALPGGKPEPEDASLAETALRETEEEVGLRRDTPRLLGRLDPVPTPTGFMIVPFVAWAPPGWRPRPTSAEVQRVLTPALTELADPRVHRVAGVGVWEGHRYEMHEFAIHDPPLWGATARMVWDLLERLRGPSSCPVSPS
jgi:8-oxo-dGTP pyrophosphatase MutT (NUDIX family)